MARSGEMAPNYNNERLEGRNVRRGRSRVLPAWMKSQEGVSINGHEHESPPNNRAMSDASRGRHPEQTGNPHWDKVQNYSDQGGGPSWDGNICEGREVSHGFEREGAAFHDRSNHPRAVGPGVGGGNFHGIRGPGPPGPGPGPGVDFESRNRLHQQRQGETDGRTNPGQAPTIRMERNGSHEIRRPDGSLPPEERRFGSWKMGLGWCDDGPRKAHGWDRPEEDPKGVWDNRRRNNYPDVPESGSWPWQQQQDPSNPHDREGQHRQQSQSHTHPPHMLNGPPPQQHREGPNPPHHRGPLGMGTQDRREGPSQPPLHLRGPHQMSQHREGSSSPPPLHQRGPLRPLPSEGKGGSNASREQIPSEIRDNRLGPVWPPSSLPLWAQNSEHQGQEMDLWRRECEQEPWKDRQGVEWKSSSEYSDWKGILDRASSGPGVNEGARPWEQDGVRRQHLHQQQEQHLRQQQEQQRHQQHQQREEHKLSQKKHGEAEKKKKTDLELAMSALTKLENRWSGKRTDDTPKSQISNQMENEGSSEGDNSDDSVLEDRSPSPPPPPPPPLPPLPPSSPPLPSSPPPPPPPPPPPLELGTPTALVDDRSEQPSESMDISDGEGDEHGIPPLPPQNPTIPPLPPGPPPHVTVGDVTSTPQNQKQNVKMYVVDSSKNGSVSESIQDQTLSHKSPPSSKKPTTIEETLAMKKERLAKALNRAKLQKARAKLRMAQKKKEDMLKVQLRKKKAHIHSQKKEAAEGGVKKLVTPTQSHKISHPNSKSHLPDVTALVRPNLLVNNLSSSGPEASVRMVVPDMQADFDCASFDEETGTESDAKDNNLEDQPEGVTIKVKRQKSESLKQKMQLLKKKLELKMAQKKRLKQNEVEGVVVEREAVMKTSKDTKGLCNKQDLSNVTPRQTPVNGNSGLEDSKDSFPDESTAISHVPKSKETPSQAEPSTPSEDSNIKKLRERQRELQQSIDLFSSNKRELEHGIEVSNLNNLVNKQRELLVQQGKKLLESSSFLRECSEQMKLEDGALETSEIRLKELLKKKSRLEGMVLTVTKKLVDGRKQREELLKRQRRKRRSDSSVLGRKDKSKVKRVDDSRTVERVVVGHQSSSRKKKAPSAADFF